MALERTSAKQEKSPPLKEEIENLELHVHKLVGEVSDKPDRAAKVEQLAETAEGQAKLLKLYDASKRFNEKIQVVILGLGATAVGVKTMSKLASDPGLAAFLADDSQFWYMLTATAAINGVFFAWLKSNQLCQNAKQILDGLKNKHE